MAYYDRVTTTTHVKTNECEPARCPECGGLECLCRPRFFAGQLLTDEDLNLLDHYIVEKNKLHNRYLHGWGVVCGLEVVCHPCNMVTVKSGYALSACGEDIVVCRDDVVDICALINKCRDKERRQWECDPYGERGEDPNCRDVAEDWVLSIRYEEKPSRGITALKGSSAPTCCTSCTCGGSSACGCGGASSGGCGCGGGCGCRGSHEGATKTSTTCQTKGRGKPVQCEPTVTCESYVYEVCRLPKRKPDRDKRDLGDLINRALRCFKCLTEALPVEPAANAPKAEWHEWCCSLKEALLDYLASHQIYDCSLAERIAQFHCPDPNSQQSDAQYRDAVKNAVQTILAPIGAAYILYCFCSSFLPPCPPPVEDPRVPLAVVTVRKDKCRVVRICNIGVRKFATTFPNLQYWLSPLPFVRNLRRVLERLCCRALPSFTGRPPGAVDVNVAGGPPPFAAPTGFAAAGATGGGTATAGTGAAEPAAAETERVAVFETQLAKVLSQAWKNRNKTIEAETVFLGALNARDDQGRPYLTNEELEDPFTLLTMNRVIAPVLRGIPDDTPGAILGRTGATAAAPPFADVESLRAQVAELQQTVRAQQAKIEDHERRLHGG